MIADFYIMYKATKMYLAYLYIVDDTNNSSSFLGFGSSGLGGSGLGSSGLGSSGLGGSGLGGSGLGGSSLGGSGLGGSGLGSQPGGGLGANAADAFAGQRRANPIGFSSFNQPNVNTASMAARQADRLKQGLFLISLYRNIFWK